MSVEQFVLSIISSILAGIIILTITAIISKKARWLLTGILGRLLKVDIDTVIPEKKIAAEDIKKELRRSYNVSIFTSRGNELQRDTFDPILLHRPATSITRVRILLPQTVIPPGIYDWTAQRDRELAQFDRAFGKGLLHKQIESNVQFLEKYLDDNKLELRRVNCPHIGRIILTERYVYFTPYRLEAHGRYSISYKYRRGEMYDNYERLFEQLWEAGKEAELPNLSNPADAKSRSAD